MEKETQNNGRKAFKKSDLLLVGGLLVLCLGFLGLRAWKQSQGPAPTGQNFAVLARNGEYLASYDLGLYQDHQVLSLEEPYGIPGKLEFQEGAVRFIEMDCPDKICEAAGYVKGELDAAICLPNRASLMIYTPEDHAALMRQLGLEK